MNRFQRLLTRRVTIEIGVRSGQTLRLRCVEWSAEMNHDASGLTKYTVKGLKPGTSLAVSVSDIIYIWQVR